MLQSVEELNDEIDFRSRLIDEAQADLEKRSDEWARADDAYRTKKSIVFLGAEGTVDARKAVVDRDCAKERLAAHIAEALKDAAHENVRNKRAQLSAVQTKCANVKAEAQVTMLPTARDRRDEIRF